MGGLRLAVVGVTLGLVLFGAMGIASTGHAEAKKGGPKATAPTLSLNQTDPHLGDSVTFSYTVPNGANSARIQLVCYQGSAGVYGADQAASTAFLLGGYGSAWLSDGAPATCHAVLYQNGGGGYQFFASTDFAAAGAR